MNHILCSYAEVLGTIKHFSMRFAKTIIQHYPLTAVNFSILTAVFLFYSPTAAAALNCDQKPSCEELGYSRDDFTDCPANKILHCPFDARYKNCIIPHCSDLGFTISDKSSWCADIVKCPLNNNYTLCGKAEENPCPSGYDPKLKSIADCGTQGSKGWTFEKQTIPSTSGTAMVCGRCTPNACSGFSTTYLSLNDCGSASITDKSGWKFTTCYAGDELRGKCSAYISCSERGFPYTSSNVNDGLNLCKTTTVRLGDSTTSCYDCVRCTNAVTWPSRVAKIDIGPQGAASYCSNHSSYIGAFGTTWSSGTWRDNAGRTATRCKVMSTHQNGQLGVTCDGCCKLGDYDNSECYRGWTNKRCATL